MKRLEELTHRWDVSDRGTVSLRRFLDLLAQDEHAPTTVREPERAVDAHIADALSGLLVPELERAALVADLGAGAGVPGLILAAARPEMRIVEVESVGRKCAWMEQASAAMGLENVEVVTARAEEWQAGRERCEAVTARALAPLPVLVEYAAPLLAPGGVLVAWKGAPDSSEVVDGAFAARVLGLEQAAVVDVPPFPGADRRNLYVYRRVGSVPNGYPRRAGIARKRPLQAST